MVVPNGSRRWCFTLNNYTLHDETLIQTWEYNYLVIGREIGSSGTPHLQGFICFPKVKRLSALKKLNDRMHWEVAKGTSQEASDYCKKDGDYIEFGTVPFAGQRTDLMTCIDIIKGGGTIKDVAENCPATYIQTYRGLAAYSLAIQPPYSHDAVRGIWIWGQPGVGKSRKAREENPEAYIKPQNKWFDGYFGQSVIILDDLDKGGICLSHYLKIWADRYACTGETKGGTVHLRHTKFVVTSNYSIEDLWGDDPQLVDALKRRFDVLHMISFNDILGR